MIEETYRHPFLFFGIQYGQFTQTVVRYQKV